MRPRCDYDRSQPSRWGEETTIRRQRRDEQELLSTIFMAVCSLIHAPHCASPSSAIARTSEDGARSSAPDLPICQVARTEGTHRTSPGRAGNGLNIGTSVLLPLRGVPIQAASWSLAGASSLVRPRHLSEQCCRVGLRRLRWGRAGRDSARRGMPHNIDSFPVVSEIVMSMARIERFGRWCATEGRRVSDRLGLSWRGWCALGAGILALGAAMSVLAGVSEDVTQHNGLATSDPSHLRFFIAHRSDVLVHASRIVTDLGNVAIVAVIAIAGGLLLWRRGLPIIMAAAPAVAMGVAAVIGDLAKRIVDRGRPPMSLRLIVEGEPSFPSGHATNAAAVYLTIGLLVAVFMFRRPLLRAAAVASTALIATAVGASRLVLGVHWPSDVLAGLALGAVVALGVTIGATLLVALMPTDLTPPRGRFQRVLAVVGQFLILERGPMRHRRTSFRTA